MLTARQKENARPAKWFGGSESDLSAFHGLGLCLWGPRVPIRPFLQGDHSFGPEEIVDICGIRRGLAQVIIEFAKAGERDPERLCALALQPLSK